VQVNSFEPILLTERIKKRSVVPT